MRSAEKGEKEYLQQAVSCLETVRSEGYAQLTDLYNLAATYDSLERLAEEKELLLEMEKKYPEEYEVCIRLAYVCYRMENDRTMKTNDYKDVEKYYEKALRICERQGIRWEEEVSVLQMQEIIDQLKESGWLSEQGAGKDDGK